MADPRAVLRLLKMHHTHKRTLELYTENLRRKVATTVSKISPEANERPQASAWPALEEAAAAARTLDPSVLNKLFATLPVDISEELERAVYSFEALPGLPNRSIQIIVRRTQARDLALSLVNATGEIEGAVLDNVSARAATMIREDRESLISSGDIAESDVSAARDRISDIIRTVVRNEVGS
jgi:flagellar motor switch protein FliG